jgi:lipopolysaccharide/colanic/teichoic acid biosynthesis glycosyltransferase
MDGDYKGDFACLGRKPTNTAVKKQMLKRSIDISLSALMLIATLPISIVIAVGIKLEDGGEIFFRQKRWGLAGKIFKVLKFRTMQMNSGPEMARESDLRVTRLGRFLRSMGLDELPQILNILKGEMSFVGPRPLAIDEKLYGGHQARYEDLPGFEERLSVRPGLTSLATIYIPKDSDPRRKFKYDLLYVRKASLALDLKLIGLSYLISLSGRWEHRKSKLS